MNEATKKIEAEISADAAIAKGWLKRGWVWAKNTSWKTKATVGVILLAVLLCGMASAYRPQGPEYVTRSEASVMLSFRTNDLQSSIDAMSRRMDTMEAGLNQLDSRTKALEAKPEPSNITTGSISKKAPARKRIRKSASESSWFDLP